MKNSHELKLCLIRDTLLNLRQVEGQYDLPINYSVEKDAKSVYAKQNEFIASMKFVEVKCLMNKFNIVNVNDKSGMEIIKPEFFYLIGENFSNCFNEMSFNCFLDDSSNFYISLSELKLLIPKFFKKNIENSKNYYVEIDDNLYSEMIGIVEYLLCSTLKQPLFNTIHY